MRIVGYIDDPVLKISILHMNHRYAVKFEKFGLEQTYKIRESQKIQNVADIRKIVSEDYKTRINSIFSNMEHLRAEFLIKSGEDDSNFEEII